MSTPTITRARPIRNTHVAVAADLLAQYAHLPMPTSVTVATKDGIDVAVELTVDTAAQVDAWAEEMRVDVEHEPHRDGTWTDTAAGMLPVVTRSPYTHEHVVVHVYSPQAGVQR